jgi:transposase
LAHRRVVDLIFLDEFGANTKMQRTHGRAEPGERVVASVPHSHYKTISTIAALSTQSVIASISFDGGTTAARFIGFVIKKLIPVLRKGQVVVLDNLAAHNDRRVDELIEAVGCQVMRLPPYSPDFNPIENAISKIKAMLRKLAKRTVHDLFKGIGVAIKSVTANDAKAFIKHCGYATKRRKPL